MPRLPAEQFEAYGDDIAPSFEMLISGKDAQGAQELFESIRPLIAGVSFEDDEEMSSMLVLTVINQPETAPGQPVNWRAVIDSKAFSEGNSIDLWMGYGSSMTFMDRAEIVKWLPSFPEEGPGSFQIKAFDGRHKMQIGNQPTVTGGGGQKVVKKDPKTLESVVTTKSGKSKGKSKAKKKQFFKNMTDDQIVRKIAEKYGYGYNVDTAESRKRATKTVVKDKKTGKSKTKVQHVLRTRVQGADMSDWEFLQKLADLNRFDLWVDWSLEQEKWIVHFKKREDTGQAGYLFEYNPEPDSTGTLISAEPDFSMKDQSTDVEVLVYDKKKRRIEKTVISDTTPGEEVKLGGQGVAPAQLQAKKEFAAGARVRFSAFGQTFEAFSGKPFKSRKDAENFVTNLLRERERDFMTISGKVVGVPDLRARQFHELRGLGKRLDGLYRFTNVRHNQQPGTPYTCDFVAHKVLGTLVSRTASTSEAKKK